MPYTLEKKGKGYKLHLNDDPTRVFSKKYQTKQKAIKQMQAIEISKAKRKLSGGGIWDKIKRGAKSILKTGVDYVTKAPVAALHKLIPEPLRYTPTAQGMINKYGKFEILDLSVEKRPVGEGVRKISNALSVGELDDAMQKHNIDKLYHLKLKVEILTGTGQNLALTIEKNATIDISVWKNESDLQTLAIDLMNKKITINELLTKTRLAIGDDKFFLYRGLEGQNCGDFCVEVLKANGLMQEYYKKFMYQEVIKKAGISQGAKDRMNLMTKLAGVASHLGISGLAGGKLNKSDFDSQKNIRFI
jgi:hypothetical protein